MKKNNKAAQVIEMLKAGESVTFIKRMLAVSESYIYMLKKKLEEGAEEVVDTVRQTAAEHNDKIKEMVEGWRAEAEDEAIIKAAAALKEACTFTPKREGVDAILNERATTYGRFVDVAEIAQEIKATIRIGDTNRSEELPADQIEALDMIASKMGRILGGDSNYVDSWIDIAGYATLVADRLQGKSR
jgi:uncharacterized protein YdhG (YjbR/CyaY superfamily)